MLHNPNASPAMILMRCIVLIALSTLSPATPAALVENLYRVELPVPDQSQAVRNAVFVKGLDEVLVRVSGKRDINSMLKTGSASSYVQTFTYLEEDAASGPASADATVRRQAGPVYTLRVEYNAARIIDLLRSQNQPVWGNRRDEAVIWLAVRDGVNRYILADTDNSLLKDAAEDAAGRRGLPLVWPLNDLTDQQQVQFSDIWASFEKPVKSASQRYGNGPVLIGRMSWNGDQWKGEWSAIVEDRRSNWSLSGSDYSALINEAIDLSTDFIAGFYAVVESPDEAGMVIVSISPLDTLGDFRKIQKYLSGLAAVRDVYIERMDESDVRFRVQLRGNIDAFVRSVTRDAILVPVAGDLQTTQVEGERMIMQYRYRN